MVGPLTVRAISRTALEVAVGGDREPGLDHVDLHLGQQLRDPDLLVERHRRAGRLLAVAQVVSKMTMRLELASVSAFELSAETGRLLSMVGGHGGGSFDAGRVERAGALHSGG